MHIVYVQGENGNKLGLFGGDRGRASFLQLPRRLTTARGQVMFISARSFTFAALSVKTRMTGALIIVR